MTKEFTFRPLYRFTGTKQRHHPLKKKALDSNLNVLKVIQSFTHNFKINKYVV